MRNCADRVPTAFSVRRRLLAKSRQVESFAQSPTLVLSKAKTGSVLNKGNPFLVCTSPQASSPKAKAYRVDEYLANGMLLPPLML